MEFWKKAGPGLLLCLILAIPSWLLGHAFPVIGGPVFAILMGMVVSLVLRDRTRYQAGIAFTSKKILQYAVILLGFGLNLSEIAKVGAQSLPIICTTITMSLLIAFILRKRLNVPSNISVLVGVGCGLILRRRRQAVQARARSKVLAEQLVRKKLEQEEAGAGRPATATGAGTAAAGKPRTVEGGTDAEV